MWSFDAKGLFYKNIINHVTIENNFITSSFRTSRCLQLQFFCIWLTVMLNLSFWQRKIQSKLISSELCTKTFKRAHKFSMLYCWVSNKLQLEPPILTSNLSLSGKHWKKQIRIAEVHDWKANEGKWFWHVWVRSYEKFGITEFESAKPTIWRNTFWLQVPNVAVLAIHN